MDGKYHMKRSFRELQINVIINTTIHLFAKLIKA
jgi:hypothetical protein